MYKNVFEVPVKLWAFQQGITRMVYVPLSEVNIDDPESLLERVFYYGQNDFQLMPRLCSVSVGDVAELKGERWLCSTVGWRRMSQGEYKKYIALTEKDRRFSIM